MVCWALGQFIVRFLRARFACALIVIRVSEAASPTSPPMTINHTLLEIPGRGLHNRQLPLEPPPDAVDPPPEGGVDDPKSSVIDEAAASLEVRVGRARLFSIRCRIENSS